MALNPERHEYHNLLGTAYLRNRQMDDAAGEFKTAAELNDKNPSDPKHNDNAGMYWYNAGVSADHSGQAGRSHRRFRQGDCRRPEKGRGLLSKGINLIGKAKLDKDGKMSGARGHRGGLSEVSRAESRTDSSPNPVKEMLAMIGAKVETQYGTAPKGKK